MLFLFINYMVDLINIIVFADFADTDLLAYRTSLRIFFYLFELNSGKWTVREILFKATVTKVLTTDVIFTLKDLVTILLTLMTKIDIIVRIIFFLCTLTSLFLLEITLMPLIVCIIISLIIRLRVLITILKLDIVLVIFLYVFYFNSIMTLLVVKLFQHIVLRT